MQDLLHVYYSAATGTAPTNYLKYPRNHPNNTLEYNRRIRAYMAENYPMATYVDFFNISLEATTANHTTDGLHLLTDANMMKAMVMLSVMRLTPLLAHTYTSMLARPYTSLLAHPYTSLLAHPYTSLLAHPYTSLLAHPYTSLLAHLYTSLLAHPYTSLLAHPYTSLLAHPYTFRCSSMSCV